MINLINNLDLIHLIFFLYIFDILFKKSFKRFLNKKIKKIIKKIKILGNIIIHKKITLTLQ